jgi:osmotically-inducible protein OsmY
MSMRLPHGLLCAALAGVAALWTTGCGNRGENANGNTNNGNANRAAVNSNYNATGTTAATPMASDTALENTIKANLTKAGISGVEVDAEDGVVTLKGNVPRAKMPEAVKAANDAGPKKVNNQLNAQ